MAVLYTDPYALGLLMQMFMIAIYLPARVISTVARELPEIHEPQGDGLPLPAISEPQPVRCHPRSGADARGVAARLREPVEGEDSLTFQANGRYRVVDRDEEEGMCRT